MSARILSWPGPDPGAEARLVLFRRVLAHALAFAAARPPRSELAVLRDLAALSVLHRRHLEEIAAAGHWQVIAPDEVDAARPVAAALCVRLSRAPPAADLAEMEAVTLSAYDRAIALSPDDVATLCRGQRDTLCGMLAMIRGRPRR